MNSTRRQKLNVIAPSEDHSTEIKEVLHDVDVIQHRKASEKRKATYRTDKKNEDNIWFKK
jgi:hypothetical protein